MKKRHLFKSLILTCLIGFMLSVSVSSIQARTVRIKLGTFAPESTFWVTYLKEMGEEWKKLSGGDVRLNIYAGGVAGDEPAMVRKLNIGQLTSATLTTQGLSAIVPDILVFNTPMLFKSEAEVAWVLKNMRKDIEGKLEKEGYIVIHWGTLGWNYLFSKARVMEPTDLEPLKLFIGTPDGSKIYQKAGFSTVSINKTDTLMSLQTNLVSAYNTSPLESMAYQWFGLAPNMLDYPWSPALAATIVKKRTWKKIDPAIAKQLMAVSEKTGLRAEKRVAHFDKMARDLMVKNGLSLNKPTATQIQLWEKRFEKTYPLMESKVGSATFQKVEKLLQDFRAGQK